MWLGRCLSVRLQEVSVSGGSTVTQKVGRGRVKVRFCLLKKGWGWEAVMIIIILSSRPHILLTVRKHSQPPSTSPEFVNAFRTYSTFKATLKLIIELTPIFKG